MAHINLAEALSTAVETLTRKSSEEWVHLSLTQKFIDHTMPGLEAELGISLRDTFTARLSKNGRYYLASPSLMQKDGELILFFGYRDGQARYAPVPKVQILAPSDRGFSIVVAGYQIPVYPRLVPAYAEADISGGASRATLLQVLESLSETNGANSTPRLIDALGTDTQFEVVGQPEQKLSKAGHPYWTADVKIAGADPIAVRLTPSLGESITTQMLLQDQTTFTIMKAVTKDGKTEYLRLVD